MEHSGGFYGTGSWAATSCQSDLTRGSMDFDVMSVQNVGGGSMGLVNNSHLDAWMAVDDDE